MSCLVENSLWKFSADVCNFGYAPLNAPIPDICISNEKQISKLNDKGLNFCAITFEKPMVSTRPSPLKGNTNIIFLNTLDLLYSREAHKLKRTLGLRPVFPNKLRRALHATWLFRDLGALFATWSSSGQRCSFASKFQMFPPLRIHQESHQPRLHTTVR